ncbi:hypothetical protein [Salinisphaera sp.]|uniref:hypothetical protein n=1 Tax=Salinisphaera sp. TaxID=1914330 RepID=UPI0025EE7BFB|nr:hypothetical protein [Salinisphaera sp.]
MKKLSFLLIGGVILVVFLYAATIVVLAWPLKELSIANFAVFGDSFGFLSSLFSGLAFVGLIITIVMQKDELAMQRDELKLQRRALESQVQELERMSRYSALDQVRSMLRDALSRLSESGGEVTRPEHFFSAMMPGPEWKTMIESIHPQEVMEAYQTHSKKTSPAKTFVGSFSGIAKFYLRSVGNDEVDYGLEPNEFIFINQSWLKDVPYISEHLLPTAQFAESQLNYEPARKMFVLAFLVASQKMAGSTDVVKEGSVEELVAYLTSRDSALPAIVNT